MFTAVLCYAQPLKNGICTASEYFLKLPFSVTPVIKRLRNLGRIQYIAKSSSIYTKSCLRHKHNTFLRKFGGNSPLRLSSLTHFAKIEDKNVIA